MTWDGAGEPLPIPASIELLEASTRRVALPVLAAFAALGIHAALELRGLYADSPHFILQMMVHPGFFFANPARRIANMMQEFPVVLALQLGVADAELLSRLFGLALYLVPLALVAACYGLVPRGQKAYFLFPFFHYLAGSEAAGFVGIVEAPLASAYFWFLLFLIVFRRAPWWVLGLAALPAIYLHEAFLFLGPVLALASAWRARSEPERERRAAYRMLVVLFLLIAAMDIVYIVDVPDPSSRDSFIRAIVLLGFLIDYRQASLNAPALMGVAALAAAWLAVRFEHRAMAILCVFGSLCAVLVGATAAIDWLFVPAKQFQARGIGVLLSLPLAALFLLSLRRPSWASVWSRPAIVWIALVLALGQLGWQAVGTWYWSGYVEDFKTVLTANRGLVSWQQARASLPPQRARIFERVTGFWTNPSLSIVLSPHGKVDAIIDNPTPVGWQPFDPANPEDLPRTPLFDTSGYRAAITNARGTHAP